MIPWKPCEDHGMPWNAVKCYGCLWNGKVMTYFEVEDVSYMVKIFPPISYYDFYSRFLAYTFSLCELETYDVVMVSDARSSSMLLLLSLSLLLLLLLLLTCVLLPAIFAALSGLINRSPNRRTIATAACTCCTTPSSSWKSPRS